jgi:tetratricopeptide (TPR) repeat protein
MDASDALIVICSPAAAKSRWVKEEIRYFQSIGRRARIFCLIVAGSPDVTAADCAFPEAILKSADGEPLGEALAAEVVTGHDNKRTAMLRIAAGLLGVGIDDLKRRDTQRRLRIAGFVTAGSVAIAIVMVGFAIMAQLARQEAEVRRVQAEGLIRFMLGDLRSKLEPLGRLDVLDAVGNEAMTYFAQLGNLGTEQELLARAMALRQIGEVRFRQGQLPSASEAFEQSLTIARSLRSQAPDNGEYLFELGQAEFWVGYAAFEQSHLEQAENGMQKYMEYGRELLAMSPNNARYDRELGFAYSNLGTILLERRKSAEALQSFRQGRSIFDQLIAKSPDDLELKHQAANLRSWIAETLLELGRLQESEDAYQKTVNELRELRDTGASELYAEHLGENAYHLADAHLNQGEISDAERFVLMSRQIFDELVANDPDNAIWRSDRAIAVYHLAELHLVAGDRETARELLNGATVDFETLLTRDPHDLRTVENLALTERLLARIARVVGATTTALDLSARAESRLLEGMHTETVRARTAISAAIVEEERGAILLASGDASMATSIWQRALERLKGYAAPSPAQLAIERKLALDLGLADIAADRSARLAAIGFDDPRFQ